MLQINPNKFFIKQTKSQLTLLIRYTLTSEKSLRQNSSQTQKS